MPRNRTGVLGLVVGLRSAMSKPMKNRAYCLQAREESSETNVAGAGTIGPPLLTLGHHGTQKHKRHQRTWLRSRKDN